MAIDRCTRPAAGHRLTLKCSWDLALCRANEPHEAVRAWRGIVAWAARRPHGRAGGNLSSEGCGMRADPNTANGFVASMTM
jgi:hypothetical protein